MLALCSYLIPWLSTPAASTDILLYVIHNNIYLVLIKIKRRKKIINDFALFFAYSIKPKWTLCKVSLFNLHNRTWLHLTWFKKNQSDVLVGEGGGGGKLNTTTFQHKHG